MTSETEETVLDLPDVLDGHWGTAEGREKAVEYAGWDRQRLMKADHTDFALANAVYMADRGDLDLIVWQTAAKERIRWLSAQLAVAQRQLAALSRAPEAGRGGARRIAEVIRDNIHPGEEGPLSDLWLDCESAVLAALGPNDAPKADWLADVAQAAFEAALPDDASPYEIGSAWRMAGVQLAAVLAENYQFRPVDCGAIDCVNGCDGDFPPGECPNIRAALKRLTVAAHTSGGTAGPDAELMAACDQAERALLHPSPEMGEVSREEWRVDLEAAPSCPVEVAFYGGLEMMNVQVCVKRSTASLDAYGYPVASRIYWVNGDDPRELDLESNGWKAVAWRLITPPTIADVDALLTKLKENGLSREELGGLARSQPGRDAQERSPVPPLSDGEGA